MELDTSSFLRTTQEKELYARLTGIAHQAVCYGTPYASGFLNPFEQSLASSIANAHPDLKVEFFGGTPNAERALAVFSPEYIQLDAKDYIVSFLLENANRDLRHADVLGVILSLGLDRKVVGDVYFSFKRAFVIFTIAKHAAGWIQSALTQIKRHTVKLTEVCTEDYPPDVGRYTYRPCISSSLRADAVLSVAFGLRREEVKQKMKAGHLKVNHRVEFSPHTLLSAGDLISFRGCGRAKICEPITYTKKENVRWLLEERVEDV